MTVANHTDVLTAIPPAGPAVLSKKPAPHRPSIWDVLDPASLAPDVAEALIGLQKRNEALFAELEETNREAMSLILALEDKNQELEKAYTELNRVAGELESRVAQRTEELAKANQAKSDFLANMSHELRTPLNGIMGLTELLLRRPHCDGDEATHLQMIRDAAETLTALVNDVLDLSRIEAGKLTIEPSPFSPRSLLRDLLVVFRMQATAKTLELACTVDPQLPPFLLGDCQRLRQVLVNLITNAIKFTQQGRIDVDVRIESALGADPVVMFTVRDTGIGIPSHRLDAIFEPFLQLDSSSTRRYGGMGLGLGISKRLVGLMNGRIWVESGLGTGSAFHFSVPMKIAPEPAAEPGPSPEVVPLEEQRTLRVLLAEDNALNQFVAAALLRELKHQVVVVGNGREAVQAAQKQTFDLILMDVQMPEMDGFAATALIRRHEETTRAHTPIVAMTAHAMKGDAEKCLAAGMDGYLPKPVTVASLLDTIARVLGATRRLPSTGLPAAMGPTKTLLDLARLKSNLGGRPDILLHIVKHWLTNAPAMLAEIRDHLRAGSSEQLKASVHKFKGALSNLCAPAAFEAATALYQAVLAGDSPQQIEELFVRMEPCVVQLVPLLTDIAQESDHENTRR